ncbi:MAG: hypothetical protein ABID79_04690 [Elusimicrobiota bacterium]
MKKRHIKNDMRTSMRKPIIDAEAFMKFFEETTGAKFVDVETSRPALDIIAKQTGKKVISRDNFLNQKFLEENKKKIP